jgi:hypothetical protein
MDVLMQKYQIPLTGTLSNPKEVQVFTVMHLCKVMSQASILALFINPIRRLLE